MPIPWPTKDPNDVLDYGFDFSPLINDADDAIATTTAAVVSGTVVIDSHDPIPGSQETVTWLSGGTVGTASIRLRATTTKGRTVDQTMSLTIAER